MTSYISHTSIDCRNAFELSEWWKQVLEYVDKPDDPNEPGHEECWIERPDGGHPLLFIEVPEEKTIKNRIHLDLRPSAGSRDDELGRLLDLGATQVADLRNDDGTGWVVLTDPEDTVSNRYVTSHGERGWVVLADPEGNEFCVLPPER